MDTNEMQIFAGRVVFLGLQDAVINVLLTPQALVARTAEGEASNHWKQQKRENSLHSFHHSVGNTKYSKECCTHLNVWHF